LLCSQQKIKISIWRPGEKTPDDPIIDISKRLDLWDKKSQKNKENLDSSLTIPTMLRGNFELAGRLWNLPSLQGLEAGSIHSVTFTQWMKNHHEWMERENCTSTNTGSRFQLRIRVTVRNHGLAGDEVVVDEECDWALAVHLNVEKDSAAFQLAVKDLGANVARMRRIPLAGAAAPLRFRLYESKQAGPWQCHKDTTWNQHSGKMFCSLPLPRTGKQEDQFCESLANQDCGGTFLPFHVNGSWELTGERKYKYCSLKAEQEVLQEMYARGDGGQVADPPDQEDKKNIWNALVRDEVVTRAHRHLLLHCKEIIQTAAEKETYAPEQDVIRHFYRLFPPTPSECMGRSDFAEPFVRTFQSLQQRADLKLGCEVHVDDGDMGRIGSMLCATVIALDGDTATIQLKSGTEERQQSNLRAAVRINHSLVVPGTHGLAECAVFRLAGSSPYATQGWRQAHCPGCFFIADDMEEELGRDCMQAIISESEPATITLFSKWIPSEIRDLYNRLCTPADLAFALKQHWENNHHQPLSCILRHPEHQFILKSLSYCLQQTGIAVCFLNCGRSN
jgi:hypothetical protein